MDRYDQLNPPVSEFQVSVPFGLINLGSNSLLHCVSKSTKSGQTLEPANLEDFKNQFIFKKLDWTYAIDSTTTFHTLTGSLNSENTNNILVHCAFKNSRGIELERNSDALKQAIVVNPKDGDNAEPIRSYLLRSDNLDYRYIKKATLSSGQPFLAKITLGKGAGLGAFSFPPQLITFQEHGDKTSRLKRNYICDITTTTTDSFPPSRISAEFYVDMNPIGETTIEVARPFLFETDVSSVEVSCPFTLVSHWPASAYFFVKAKFDGNGVELSTFLMDSDGSDSDDSDTSDTNSAAYHATLRLIAISICFVSIVLFV